MRAHLTRPRRALIVVLAGLLVLAAGCGGDEGAAPDPEPEQPSGTLAAVEENLEDIRSGQIAVAVRATSADGPPASWEMTGRFAAAEDDERLPVTDLTYIDREGDGVEESRFVADGEGAWVVTPRGPRPVEGDSLDGLRGGEDPAGLRGLHLSEWFSGDVQPQPGEPIDGTSTTAYTGEVDIIAVMNDVLTLAANMRAVVPRDLTGGNTQRVRDAVQSAEVQVLANSADDFLRRVILSMDLTTEGTELRDAIGELSGSRIEMELTLTDINEPIEPPEPPEGAQAATTTVAA
ncbi:MAG: hypothetical protein KY395_01600 [Actinobacteria bacterium]|nr:hypothetical protein [Actinomycetota bacterium]